MRQSNASPATPCHPRPAPLPSLERQRRIPARTIPRLVLGAILTLSGCTVQPGDVIPADVPRVAFQSQCAQNVVECTSSWPTAAVRVEAGEGAVLTPTDTGFLVTTATGADHASVALDGSDSQAGDGAAELLFSWSSGATDDNPCVLTPGTEFSDRARPTIALATGVHYIRLTVRNDIIRDRVESPTCGLIATNVRSYDFAEVEIEVR